MGFTADRSENDKELLTSLLKLFSMLKIKCWYSTGGVDKITAEKLDIRCSNCGKETMIDLDIMNTTYHNIITTSVLDTMLHHAGILWIIETHEHLQYDIDKHNSEWISGGPWYNPSICKKLHGNVSEGFIRNTRTDRYNIMCYIDADEQFIHQNIIMEAVVVVIRYHKIQQQKHYFCSEKP